MVTWLTKLALYGAALIGAAMSVVVFAAVALRYIFLSPVPFTDELVGLLFSAMVFLAIPYLFASGSQHPRVADRRPLLAARLGLALGLISNLGIIVFFLVLGYLSFDFAAFSLAIGARTDVAQLSSGALDGAAAALLFPDRIRRAAEDGLRALRRRVRFRRGPPGEQRRRLGRRRGPAHGASAPVESK